MKTNKIFKTLALAILVPTMLLNTACSNEDEVTLVQDLADSSVIPVTVSVTRQGDNAITRASYNEDTKILSFTSGDQLYVSGTHSTAGEYSGTLTYVSGNTFSGELTTQHTYSGTANTLFSESNPVKAVFLPYGYGTYGYLTIQGGVVTTVPDKAFVETKALAVEQLSYEMTETYSSGFTLAPENAIINCDITNLPTQVAFSFYVSDGTNTSTGSTTTDVNGHAKFAVAFPSDGNSKTYTIQIGLGSEYEDIVIGTKTLVAGHIYNVARYATKIPTVITWNSSFINGITYTNNGLTETTENNTSQGFTVNMSSSQIDSYFHDGNLNLNYGTLTFTSTVGNISKIEITATSVQNYATLPSGWSVESTKLIWNGGLPYSSEVTLTTTGGNLTLSGISQIDFTIQE